MKNVKLEELALAKLKECRSGDTECDHGNADDVLCWLLRELEYDSVVSSWETIDKWYA